MFNCLRRRLIVCLAASLTLALPGVALADTHTDLIGKPAPEIPLDFSFNGKAAKLSDLKGKVVLVDFWAVWCPPCVKSFPNLRDLHAKYGKDGLVIVGVTNYYEKFGFDKDSGTLLRNQKLTQQEEQDMLKAFAGYHKLEYQIATVSKKEQDKIYEKYGVEGIPQAVLIDRKGNVKKIKVGFSEEGFRELDEQIKKLIAEKE